MKKLISMALISMALISSGFANAALIDFETFNIRNNDGSIDGPWDSDLNITENSSGDGFTGMTSRGGQKIGYGTSAFDGMKVNSLNFVNYTIDAGSVSSSYPYLNLWLTDGINYAILALGGDYRGNDLNGSSSNWLLYEYDISVGVDWLFSGTGYSIAGHALSNGGGSRVSLSEFANDVVFADPGNPYPSYVGTGAPRGGYGLNIIYGDTAANYIGGMSISELTVGFDGETFAAANAVPEPAALALFGLGFLMLVGFRKKTQQFSTTLLPQ